MTYLARIHALTALVLLALTSATAPVHAADIGVAAGVLSYASPSASSIDNLLTISLAGGTYTIDDPAEPALTLTAEALAAGCVAFDSNTVTCPVAAIAAFDIATRLGIDTIVLTGAAHPARVNGGDGNDTFLGGNGDDTFVWSPGDDDDVVDGGPGSDTVVFNGSNAAEAYTIIADGAGFDLTRNVANVRMQVENAETLELVTAMGADTVTTTALVGTDQLIVDADDAATDVLKFDAAGLCPFFQADRVEVVGRRPVQFAGFPSVLTSNAVCGATLDLSGGVLSYTGTPQIVANTLAVALAGQTYTLHDAGELISITPNAADEGCVSVDANTATCPAAALGSLSIATRAGDDTIVLSGAAHPAMVQGGDGDDTLLGGAAGDTLVWNPGDDDDVVDGGPGDDSVVFNGSNASEIFAITAAGAGFVLTRNVANVRMEVGNAESLLLSTLGGDDEVSTTSLLRTAQLLTAGTDVSPDTLRVDGAGLCLDRVGDSYEAAGRQPIHFTNFPAVLVSNVFCRVDPCAGAVPSQGCRVNGVRDQPCQGTDGDDVIVGTTAGDVILGGGGRDRIRAGSGDDLVCGEDGDDRLTGSAGNDTLSGGPGADRLQDSAGNDTLLGDDGNDDLKSGSGDDDLDGGPGDDRLRAGSDIDTLRGGEGVDRIDGGGDADTCTDADQVGPFIKCELP
jgi:Ca2+-binding RTX toxin-like protein